MRQLKLYIAPLLKCSFAISQWYRFHLNHRHSFDLRGRCPLQNIYFGRYHYPDMEKAQRKTSAALGKYMTSYISIFPYKNIFNLAGNRTSSCLKSRLDPGQVNSSSIRIHKETKDLGDRDVRTSKYSFEDMTAKHVLWVQVCLVSIATNLCLCMLQVSHVTCLSQHVMKRICLLSYKLEISSLAADNDVEESILSKFWRFVNLLGDFLINLNTVFLPNPNIAEVVSQPVKAWTAGRILASKGERDLLNSWIGMYLLQSLRQLVDPVKNHICSVDTRILK